MRAACEIGSAGMTDKLLGCTAGRGHVGNGVADLRVKTLQRATDIVDKSQITERRGLRLHALEAFQRGEHRYAAGERWRARVNPITAVIDR